MDTTNGLQTTIGNEGRLSSGVTSPLSAAKSFTGTQCKDHRQLLAHKGITSGKLEVLLLAARVGKSQIMQFIHSL